MAKPLLILLGVADSNQPHVDKLQFMVLMVDDHIRMSMPELNDEYYSPLYQSKKIMNMKKVLVIITLLNTFQVMNMCLILRMVFHPKITTDWEVKYWMCGICISLY